MTEPEGMSVPVAAGLVFAALTALATISTAVIAWFAYRHQRRAGAPGFSLKAPRDSADGEYTYGCEFELDPPGQPPRKVREVRVLGPKGILVTQWGAKPAWARKARISPPGASGEFRILAGSPERTIVELEFRTLPRGRFRDSVEIEDLFGIADRQQAGEAAPRETPRRPPVMRWLRRTDSR